MSDSWGDPGWKNVDEELDEKEPGTESHGKGRGRGRGLSITSASQGSGTGNWKESESDEKARIFADVRCYRAFLLKLEEILVDEQSTGVVDNEDKLRDLRRVLDEFINTNDTTGLDIFTHRRARDECVEWYQKYPKIRGLYRTSEPLSDPSLDQTASGSSTFDWTEQSSSQFNQMNAPSSQDVAQNQPVSGPISHTARPKQDRIDSNYQWSGQQSTMGHNTQRLAHPPPPIHRHPLHGAPLNKYHHSLYGQTHEQKSHSHRSQNVNPIKSSFQNPHHSGAPSSSTDVAISSSRPPAPSTGYSYPCGSTQNHLSDSGEKLATKHGYPDASSQVLPPQTHHTQIQSRLNCSANSRPVSNSKLLSPLQAQQSHSVPSTHISTRAALIPPAGSVTIEMIKDKQKQHFCSPRSESSATAKNTEHNSTSGSSRKGVETLKLTTKSSPSTTVNSFKLNRLRKPSSTSVEKHSSPGSAQYAVSSLDGASPASQSKADILERTKQKLAANSKVAKPMKVRERLMKTVEVPPFALGWSEKKKNQQDSTLKNKSGSNFGHTLLPIVANEVITSGHGTDGEKLDSETDVQNDAIYYGEAMLETETPERTVTEPKISPNPSVDESINTDTDSDTGSADVIEHAMDDTTGHHFQDLGVDNRDTELFEKESDEDVEKENISQVENILPVSSEAIKHAIFSSSDSISETLLPQKRLKVAPGSEAVTLEHAFSSELSNKSSLGGKFEDEDGIIQRSVNRSKIVTGDNAHTSEKFEGSVSVFEEESGNEKSVKDPYPSTIQKPFEECFIMAEYRHPSENFESPSFDGEAENKEETEEAIDPCFSQSSFENSETVAREDIHSENIETPAFQEHAGNKEEAGKVPDPCFIQKSFEGSETVAGHGLLSENFETSTVEEEAEENEKNTEDFFLGTTQQYAKKSKTGHGEHTLEYSENLTLEMEMNNEEANLDAEQTFPVAIQQSDEDFETCEQIEAWLDNELHCHLGKADNDESNNNKNGKEAEAEKPVQLKDYSIERSMSSDDGDSIDSERAECGDIDIDIGEADSESDSNDLKRRIEIWMETQKLLKVWLPRWVIKPNETAEPYGPDVEGSDDDDQVEPAPSVSPVSGSDDQAICFFCFRKGHFKMDCPYAWEDNLEDPEFITGQEMRKMELKTDRPDIFSKIY